ncbi:MAG TPA: hypothetical protein VGM51_02175 [Armatimonadota bacterium]|jgi:putative transposase
MGASRHYSAETEARAALESIKGLRTANEIAGGLGNHPMVQASWKKQAIAGLLESFSKGWVKETPHG